MRKITYFEDMRSLCKNKQGNTLSNAQVVALWSYNYARDKGLDYPMIQDTLACNMGDVAHEFENARIGKFYYGQASTGLKDTVAELFLAGYKVVGVVNKQDLPTITLSVCGDYVLLFGKR